MSALLESDPGLPGRFRKSVLLPATSPEDAALHFERVLRASFDAALPPLPRSGGGGGDAVRPLLLAYFKQRRQMRGRAYRNIEEAVTLAREVDAAAMRRLTAEAEAEARAGLPADAAPPRAVVDKLFMERVRAWATSGGKTYGLCDVEAACALLLQQAGRDAVDAAVNRTTAAGSSRGGGSAGPQPLPPAFAAGSAVDAPPPPPAQATAQEQRAEAPPPQPATAEPPPTQTDSDVTLTPSPALVAALGPGLTAALAALRDSDPAAYLDLLDGRAPELRARGLAQLREHHAALVAAGAVPAAAAAPPGGGELEALLQSFLTESKARLQVGWGPWGVP